MTNSIPDPAARRHVVTMESGREYVVYAHSDGHACAIVTEQKETLDALRARLMETPDGRIAKVEQVEAPHAIPIQDGRKAPGA